MWLCREHSSPQRGDGVHHPHRLLHHRETSPSLSYRLFHPLERSSHRRESVLAHRCLILCDCRQHRLLTSRRLRQLRAQQSRILAAQYSRQSRDTESCCESHRPAASRPSSSKPPPAPRSGCAPALSAVRSINSTSLRSEGCQFTTLRRIVSFSSSPRIVSGSLRNPKYSRRAPRRQNHVVLLFRNACLDPQQPQVPFASRLRASTPP